MPLPLLAMVLIATNIRIPLAPQYKSASLRSRLARIDWAGSALLAVGVGALLVGLILVLRGPLGSGGATAVVVIGALVVAGILGKLAATRLGRAFSGDGL